MSEGLHSIRLRTSNKLITLDSIRIAKGVKTFLSINANASSKHLKSVSMPDTLTTHESQLWGKYMLVIDDNFAGHFAYVKQNSHQLFLLNANNRNRQDILTGPFPTNYAKLIVKNRFEQTFATEGSWEYNISNGLIKQKQSCYPYLFSLPLSHNEPVFDFHDFVLTEKEIDSLWQDNLDINASKISLLPYYNRASRGLGQLEIGFPADKISVPFIKNVVLIRPGDPDFIRAYTGDTRSLGYLSPGKYRLVFLLKKDRYFTFDSITVLQDGHNYYEIAHIVEKERDSLSARIAWMIATSPSNTTTKRSSKAADLFTETIIDSYRNSAVFTEAVRGTVCDDAGTPLAGVTIRVKGSSNGTLTDMQGYFSMKVPPKSTIVFSYVGFMTKETRSISNHYYNIELTPRTTDLDEVIVIGYGQTRRALMSASASSVSAETLVQGTVGGLTVGGLGSLSSPPAPLIIVDGLPYAGKMEDLDRDQITSTNVLKGEEATSLYGSLAAGGVIIITTRNNHQASSDPGAAMPMNKLRRNFRDDAYWQPRLLTDAEGNASFKATFPDDITSWRTFAIAMTGNKQSGFLEKTVKSFKALSANLSLPQFAILGDSIRVIGKTLNYLSDSITVKRTFWIGNTPAKESMIRVRYSQIDTLPVTADNTDSLRLKYTIQKSDGYFDGEGRAIPIFRPGVLATSGIFAAFYKDSTLQLELEPDTTPIKLYAESTLLPVWYDEAESIRNYEYLCNEQLASKLKALLVQKRIDQYFKRSFEKEENIRDVLDRLNKGKLQTGLWGWWPNGTPSIWISLHVLEAFLAAEKSGYPIAINKTLLIDYLIYNLEKYDRSDKISGLHLLHQLGAKADFKKYIDSIEKKKDSLSFYNQLRFAELKQQLGLPVRLDTFIRLQQHTVFGNTYWGKESYYFFYNSIQLTLCMYCILRNAGGYDDLLQKIRGYFLEQRKTGHWRNTYESSLILDAILPDLLAEAPDLKPGTLTIRGREQETITRFPFYKEIRDNAPISISKKGGLPIYLTAYRQYWDEKPVKTSNNFTVRTSFTQHNKPVTLLKAGIATELKVEVQVESDADYVMIEIPIPAGCSYGDKRQPYWNYEVHREYFKNKVSIFCSSLPKGYYQYTVSLLPRYTGTYTLNPAKAEMMYFPIFNGREA
ncbi:MAG TPA: alpha-2-macroglobulin family protein, partial [Chitinophaga sp.]